MEQSITLKTVAAKLKAHGFSGLYCPNECGCSLQQLAPCGHYRTGKGQGDYLNGCKPGYVHLDPRPGHSDFGDYVVTDSPKAPSGDDFDRYYP